MSAFQSYAGAYGHEQQLYRWSCYATSRVYEVRSFEHQPLPAPPQGRKWMTLQPDRDQPAAWLVDDATAEFSQILLQIAPRGTATSGPARAPRPAPSASPEAAEAQ